MTQTARAAAWYEGLPPRRRELVQDTALALSLAVLNLLSLLPYQSRMHPAWLALFLVTAQCLPLAVRRSAPVLALVLCGLPRYAYDALAFGFAPLPLAPTIAFATVAERSAPLLRWPTLVLTAVGIALSQRLPGHNQPYDEIVQAFLFGTAWAVGTLSRRRRAALTAAASRAERAEASLDAAASRAAAVERLRIARELHDVVAHHVSLMAVQAEAVGALLPARPEAAAESADLIAAAARTAMTELRRLLGVLRFRDDHPERSRLTPVPSLSGLDDLADVVRDAGLTVTLAVSSGVAGLPPGIDLTAYRIIQEALTNALRHAPGSVASVSVACQPEAVTVQVSNTGSLPAWAGASAVTAPAASGVPAALAELSGGFGLAGIAERVASCGGTLTIGPVRGGGFAVAARLPLA